MPFMFEKSRVFPLRSSLLPFTDFCELSTMISFEIFRGKLACGRPESARACPTFNHCARLINFTIWFVLSNTSRNKGGREANYVKTTISLPEYIQSTLNQGVSLYITFSFDRAKLNAVYNLQFQIKLFTIPYQSIVPCTRNKDFKFW